MKRFFKVAPAMLLIAAMLVSMFSVFPVSAASTSGTGYDSADDVVYKTYGGYVANWGAREEDCVFLSTKAQSFYTGNYTFDVMSEYAGGTSQSNAPQSALYSQLKSFMSSKHSHITDYGETRDLYKYTDCTFSDISTISSFYSGKSVSGTWDGGSTWNREHTWPNSKGLGGSDENDIMMLRPTSVSENSGRGNTAYGESSSYYNPNSASNNTHDLRGDVARTMLYTYVRWGNTSYMWGSSGVMESLNVLLKWMEADPVDTWEMGRNDAVQSITGTRNVFVDYPEYAWLLFGKSAPTNMVTPSGKASNGTATPGTGSTTPPDVDDPAPSVTVVTSPEVGVAYKLMVEHKTIGKTLFLNGLTANKEYYLASTDDVYSGVDVYLEAVTGGYKVYFTINGTKTYLKMTQSGTYYNTGLTTSASEAAVFTWNTTYNTLTSAVADGTECYIGMYGTYETFSASKISYATSQGSFTSSLVTVDSQSGGTVTPPADTETEEESVTTAKPDVPVVPGATVNKTYTFADYTAGAQYGDETHKLDGYLTVSTHNKGCHFTTQLRIYQSDSNDGWAILTLADGYTFGNISINAGYKAAHLIVSGSNDGGKTWTQIHDVTTMTTYKDYSVDATGYSMLKLDAVSNQVRVASITANIETIEGGGATTPVETQPIETEKPVDTQPADTKPTETQPAETEPADPDAPTISFEDKANRTQYSTATQVWQQNGITVTNSKGNSTNNVGDYANPGRFYKNSTLIIEGTRPIAKIVFNSEPDTTYNDYTAFLAASIGDEAVVDGSVITLTFAQPVDSYTVVMTGGQARVYSITVYYAEGGSAPVVTNPADTETEVPTETEEPTETESTPGTSTPDASAPEAGVAYKLVVVHETVGKTLYLTGKVANKDYYFASTEDINAAIDVYVETVNGGYKVYFVLDGTKTYITVKQSGTYYNAGFVTSAGEAAVFVWNTEFNTLVTTVADGTQCYLGMYGTYETFSASKISYATSAGSFTSTLVKADADSGETTPPETETESTPADTETEEPTETESTPADTDTEAPTETESTPEESEVASDVESVTTPDDPAVTTPATTTPAGSEPESKPATTESTAATTTPEPETEAKTEAKTEDKTTETDAQANVTVSGCGSTVSGGALAIIGLAVLPILAKRKKKED